ncbi:hypothetical protein [Flavisphingopyxis soli]|uniref:hypothetical protein n=1 Tax=Flavisphingopyxis soli TaxID=2601267 RepID=UPI001F44FF73|nr:hypothetical protein [Sphingorhabdus soli]
MAKSESILPDWATTLDGLIARGSTVRVSCDTCDAWVDIDLVTLRSRTSGTYSLVDRRPPCRITEGCAGHNRFLFDGRGRMELLASR